MTFSNILAKQIDRQRYLLEKESRREDRRKRRARQRFRDPFAQIFTPPRRRNRENPFYATVDETGGPESAAVSKETLEPLELEPSRLVVPSESPERPRPKRSRSPRKRKSVGVDLEVGRGRQRHAQSRSPLRKTSAPPIVTSRDPSPQKRPRRKERRKKSAGATEPRKMRKSRTEPVLTTLNPAPTPSAPPLEQYFGTLAKGNLVGSDVECESPLGKGCERVDAEDRHSVSGNNLAEAEEEIRKLSL